MTNKLLLLKIISENQPIGTHKLDILFYSVTSFKIPWSPIMTDLKNEEMITHDNSGYKLTLKGISYLKAHT